MNFEDFKKKYQKEEVTEKSDVKKNVPLVSVCIQTYNHGKYIRQCLESILTQKTNFDFEILLGEDASKDGTRGICIEYAEKYPKKIRLFLHHRENNISIGGSPTGRFNFLYNLFSAQGKYIAICDGDDYWTDPYKLQKQMDFLEGNEEYVIHSSAAKVLKNEILTDELRGSEENKVFVLEDFYEKNNLVTATVMFKNIGIESSYFNNKIAFGDWMLYVYLLNKSKLKAYRSNEIFSIYRVHSGGVHSSMSKLNNHLNQAYQIANVKKHVKYKKTPKEVSELLNWHIFQAFKIYTHEKDLSNCIKTFFFHLSFFKRHSKIKQYASYFAKNFY